MLKVFLPAIALFYSSAFAGPIVFDVNAGLLTLREGSGWESRVVVSDQVSDGCWIGAERARKNVELILIKKGRMSIKLEEGNEDIAKNLIVMEAIGYSINENQCAISLDLTVFSYSVQDFSQDGFEVKVLSRVSTYNRGILLTGPKSNMSGRISENFEELAEGLILSVESEAQGARKSVEISVEEGDVERVISVIGAD